MPGLKRSPKTRPWNWNSKQSFKKKRCPRQEAQGLRIYQQRGIATSRLLTWSSLQSGSYYYKASGGTKGIPPSTHSVHKDGELFEKKVVIAEIETTLHQEFCPYGYRNRTGEWKEKGWIINHKKVSRLMKEHKLLYGGRIKPEAFKRDFIRFRTPGAEKPLQYLSMDIKYVHIHGWNRNVYLLTVMDIYSRKVLIHLCRQSI